jgi:penicillin amidase
MDGMELPYTHNPAKGYFGTANEFNLPADWPEGKQIGYEWIEPSRAERIEEVLSADGRHTIEGSKALQTDVLSIPARRIGRLLKDLPARNTREAAALDLLNAWDHRLTADSAAAALFEIWWSNHLRPALFKQIVDRPDVLALIGPGDVSVALDYLEAGAGDATFAALMLDSLADAFTDCESRMGADASGWSWGRVHQATFEHAASAVKPEQRESFNVGPLPFYGSDSTPMNGSYRPDDFRLTLGASFRIVVDVGAWDNSFCINTPGQSGDPRSPHYRDLAPIWAKGEYVPLLYSEEAIENAAEFRIQLIARAS